MLEEELGRMNPDMSAIAAFQAKEAEYAQRLADLQAATAERDNVSLLSPYIAMYAEHVKAGRPAGCHC